MSASKSKKVSSEKKPSILANMKHLQSQQVQSPKKALTAGKSKSSKPAL